jgi:DNA (cytosine-5)-methyltransferase 1
MNAWLEARPPSASPRTVLDICCGAGGAAHGYRNAGFAVWGVDTNPRLERDYLRSGAERFIAANALDVLADRNFVRHFDFVHASPPCQHYSQMSRCRPGLAESYPDLIGPVRELLLATGVPFVIENVGAARPWLLSPTTLCGTMFARRIYRHRLFEPGGGLTLTAPVQPDADRQNRECGWRHPVPAARAGHWREGMYVSVSGHERRGVVNEAMAIDWMDNRDDVAESVPPYMAHHVGGQVLTQLALRR